MPGMEAVNAAAREYTEPLIGAYPELEFIGWEQWGDRKQLAIQSSAEMDIVFTAIWDNFYNEVSRNAWIPLTNLIDEHAPRIYETLGFLLEGPTINGEIYAVPTGPRGAQAHQYIFNKEFVDKYNVPVESIRTPEDLDPWLELIRDNEPDVIPFLADAGVSELINSHRTHWASLGVGRDWYFYDGEVRFLWQIEELWELAEKMHEWYLAGFLPPEIDDVGVNDYAERYWESRNWFAYAGLSNPSIVDELSRQRDVEVVGTGPVVTPTVNTDILLGSMLSVGRTSRNPVAAVRMIDLMNADATLNNLLNYGLEGEHYEFVDESAGVVRILEDGGYAPYMQWALGNQTLNFLTEGEDPLKWEKEQEYIEAGVMQDTVGFFADLSTIRTQLASISNVSEVYYEQLSRGITDPSEIREEFMAALEAAGINEVAAELERQFAEFLASK